MAGKRAATEKLVLDYIEKILPESDNRMFYENLFKGMSDKQFEDFINQLDEGKQKLSIVVPNMKGPKLSVERNLKIAEELGHNFFERIWVYPDDDTPPYLSPIPYLVMDLPVRRQAQLLVKKISIPEDNKSIDDYTGQPTGKSKGSKISYPEVQIMAALDLDQNLIEMLKYRGGDIKGFNAMNTMIARTGGVSLKSIESLGTTVRSTETLAAMLKCMHLQPTGLVD